MSPRAGRPIVLADLNPGWQRRIDTVTAGVAVYRGVLRTRQGRIVVWACEDDHAGTVTAAECANRKLAEWEAEAALGVVFTMTRP